MVLLGTLAAGAESISRRAAQALCRGEDLRMAMSEPEVQSRLRTALHNERSTHLRSYGTTHAPQVGPKLTSQTVFSVWQRPGPRSAPGDLARGSRRDDAAGR